jgi:hypothetical protein
MIKQNEQTGPITKLVKEIFEKINEAKTINDLKGIEEYESLSKYKMDYKNYPRIEFAITEKEINSLFPRNNLDELTIIPETPLEKLLYAVIWKNGDLKKIKHIVHGIKNNSTEDEEKETGIVFNQFGKYLANRSSQPIIDQHVLRAFNYWTHIDNSEKAEKITTINKKHLNLINDYKNWIKGLIANNDLNKMDNSESLYLVDRILFALGKKIKNELNK